MFQIQTNSTSMTSREIAELVNSRHDKVKQAIERLSSDNDRRPAVISKPPVGDGEKSANGVTEKLYIFSGEQGKRDSIIVVAQLSPEFTARLVDRWQELESQSAQVPAIPQTYAEALQLAADQAKQLEVQAPKVEYHDKVLATENGLTTTEIAAELGMSAIALNKALQDMKVQRKVGGRWVLTVAYINQGYDVEVTHVDDGGMSRHAMKWTEKGRKLIHELMENKW